MPPHAASSSSSAAMPATKSRKRRYTRQDLLEALEILGPLSTLLPAELPPSPPASRGSSPVRGAKRKQPAVAESSSTITLPKRPRTSTSGTSNTNHTRTIRTEPTEDGEVREERTYQVAQPAFSSTFVPVRRPRRGRPPRTDPYWERAHDIYRFWAKCLKYSSETRHASSQVGSKPLIHPPPPDSAYHKHAVMIAKLEGLDSVICFAYSAWLKDYSQRKFSAHVWETLLTYTNHCMKMWGGSESAGEKENAPVGLISMLRAYFEAHLSFSQRPFLAKEVPSIASEGENTVVQKREGLKEDVRNKAYAAEPSYRDLPPKMLPSPASTIGSSNSTPTVPRSESTPLPMSANAGMSNVWAERPKNKEEFEAKVEQSVPTVQALAQHTSIVVSVSITTATGMMATHLEKAVAYVDAYQSRLNLPVLAKHFPTTFARVIQTSLQSNEEYEPDIEDDEGELYWPGQCINGEGMAWVCLMGRSMVREFGKNYGYHGYRGICRKPGWRVEIPPAHPAHGFPDIPDVW